MSRSFGNTAGEEGASALLRSRRRWATVHAGDSVYYDGLYRTVDVITHLPHNVFNTADERPHVEVMFTGSVDGHMPDGWYCILAASTVITIRKEPPP